MNTIYITLHEVLKIHDDMIQRYGGSFGIRDLGLIESALARPQASFNEEDLYPTVYAKAAALFHSLIFNHAFVDGNKRTTITVISRFLSVNGYYLEVTQEEIVSFPLWVAHTHSSFEDIEAWIKTHTISKKS